MPSRLQERPNWVRSPVLSDAPHTRSFCPCTSMDNRYYVHPFTRRVYLSAGDHGMAFALCDRNGSVEYARIGGFVGTLKRAVATGKPEIFNSDQGSQFSSIEWIKVLVENEIKISMDGRGRCFDNIFIERLWRTAKPRRSISKRIPHRLAGRGPAAKIL